MLDKKFVLLFVLLAALLISACSTGEEARIEEFKEEDILVAKDISYGSHPRQKFDVYYKESYVDAPTIFWVHGGGPPSGKKENVEPLAKLYVERGFVVVAMNYRWINVPFDYLALEESSLHDIACSVATYKTMAEDFGASPENFILHGSSAGAYRSSIVYFADEKNWLEGCKVQNEDYSIDGYIAAAGKYGVIIPEGISVTYDEEGTITGPQSFLEDVKRDYGESSQSSAKIAINGAINHITENDPPTLILHGGQDPVHPVSVAERFKEELDRIGVPNKMIVIDGVGHGLQLVNYPEVVDEIERFANAQFNNKNWP